MKPSEEEKKAFLGIPADAHLLDTVQALFELAEVAQLEMLGESGPLYASGGKKSLFMALFGRDSIRTSLDLIRYHPEVAHRSILALAELQGTEMNQRSEEEIGKIHHEYRRPDDPHRIRLEKIFDFPYYGTIDATPLFIYLTCVYALRSPEILKEKVVNKSDHSITILHSLVKAVKYLLHKTDHTPGGFLTWHRMNPTGHYNQAWKDSYDAYHHSDGTLANHDQPIAGIEVQGYLHNALRKVAELFRALEIDPLPLGLPDIDTLINMRKKLADEIRKQFWMKKENYFALGLDKHQSTFHQLDVISSNPGHLLDTQVFKDIKDGDKYLHATITKLFSPEMLSLVGVRTLSTKMKKYRAGSYHNGSVWPFDNGIIADGLRRYGYFALATEIEYRTLRAIHEVGRNVEFFRGDSDKRARINTKTIKEKISDTYVNNVEQPPQMNQAWTATRAYIIERRFAEDFYLKTKHRPKDKFEKNLLLELKRRKDLYSKPEL